MSQRDGTPPPGSSSSFPVSSPSFWNEAAAVAIPSPPTLKRLRRDLSVSSPISDENLFDNLNLDLDFDFGNDLDPRLKRPRYGSSEPAQPEPQPHSHSHSNSTNLSYLPKRTELISQDDPHAYLTNAEYAPNTFGDIGDYMRKKEIKVQAQNRDIALASAASGLPQIFVGLSFYINGNTSPPMEELRKMILQRGGEVRPVLRNKGMVKYIIAPMLTQSKFKQFERYKVVREGWITESCKEGKLLDWTKWKLQIQGGWEEGSRKGMEGFFKSQPGQTQKTTSIQPKELSPSPSPGPTIEEDPVQVKSIPINKPEPTTQKAVAAAQSLLTPLRSSVTPINPRKSPLANGSPTPARLPPKVQKPEEAWELYHSKESNENAAQAMKNQEWRARNTAERGNEGGFIDGYYQNSRLHHLSTWKAELKVLVADAQRRSEELSLSAPSNSAISPLSLANSTLPSGRASDLTNSNDGEKVIFHVDFDCFFVSCGLATRPHLKGKPTVVCHSQAGKGASSTSEIASCSYEARAKGVKNGMSLGRARTLVGEELQTIPYEFETYKKFSLAFYTILMGYADELQAVSVDEALIDVTSAVSARAMAPEEASNETSIDAEGDDNGEQVSDVVRRIKRPRDPAVEIAEKIRDEVRQVTEGCEVSIGISHNILLAKLATRSAKPAGVAHVLHTDIDSFLAPLDVGDFPSIGHSIKSKIEDKFGSTNVSELLSVNRLALQRVLGPKTGEMLYGYLRGVDERRLEPDKARKSVSAEMNYGIRFRNQEQADVCIADLAAEVSKRMKGVGVKGRQITLKLMKRHPDAPIEPPKFMGHGWCETFNRSSPLSGPRGGPTDDSSILSRESVKLLRSMKLEPVELRGVGIQVTKLDSEDANKKVEREVGQGVLSFHPKGKGKVESDVVTPAATANWRTGETKQEQVVTLRHISASAEDDDHALLRSHEEDPREASSDTVPPVLAPERSPPPPPQADPSRLRSSEEVDSIDPSFLAALPFELQEEVKRDYARTSRAVSERPDTNNVAGPSKRATTVSPVKVKKMHEAAHITRQLRPRLKTQLKAAQLADRPLFSAWTRAQDKDKDRDHVDSVIGTGSGPAGDVVDLTGSGPSSDVEPDPGPAGSELVGGYRPSELRELGIDPEVFGALPDEMRKEVIDEERRKVGRKKILLRPARGVRAGSSDASGRGARSMSMSVSPAKPYLSRGSNPPLSGPGIVISKPAKPGLFKMTEIDEINGVIERWVESRNGSGPAGKDALKVGAFLLKSVESGLGGVGRAVEVLKWMRVLLRERWADEEGNDQHQQGLSEAEGVGVGGDMGPGEESASNIGGSPGKEWWVTWRRYRDQVVDLAQNKFGAGLRI